VAQDKGAARPNFADQSRVSFPASSGKLAFQRVERRPRIASLIALIDSVVLTLKRKLGDRSRAGLLS
jgi:hypothetical protein